MLEHLHELAVGPGPFQRHRVLEAEAVAQVHQLIPHRSLAVDPAPEAVAAVPQHGAGRQQVGKPLLLNQAADRDEEGRIAVAHLGLRPEALEVDTVVDEVEATAVDEGTEISLVARVTSTTPVAPQYLAGMSQGWSQSLDRLAALAVRL